MSRPRPASFPLRLAVVAVSAVFAVVAIAPGCALATEAPEVLSRVGYHLIGTYDLARLDKIQTTELVEQGFADKAPTTFPRARYAVKLYRVTYRSVVPEQSNRRTIATGLLAVPESGARAMPVVSYQHGTVFSKDEVPSFPEKSMETRLMVARFAGQGYVVIAADYFGKGLSAEPDSYLVKESTQQACLDMLWASRSVLASMKVAPLELYLSGWSQGGWSTLVFLEKLESLGIPVKAAATASAPTDLYVTMNRWIGNHQPIDAVFLTGVVTLQILAHEAYFGREGLAASALRPDVLLACRDLYANRIDWTTFQGKTPGTVKEMLLPEFIALGASGSSAHRRSIQDDNPVEEARQPHGHHAASAYWKTIQDDNGYRWRSVTTMRNYYGDVDEVVPVPIAKLPELVQGLMAGEPTTAVAAGAKADHRGTFLFEVEDAGKWFDGLRSR